MGFIQFDFQKAYQQQLELDSIAAELNQLAERDMAEVLNQLQSAWQMRIWQKVFCCSNI